mgnify:CR=1 FL=1
MKPQAIAVVGAGTAGLASACLLARQGHRVTLIEQAPAPAPVGAGLLLQRLPGTSDTDADLWDRINHLADTLTDHELTGLDAGNVLFRLFHEENTRLFDPAPLMFSCTCSRERFGAALHQLGADELRSVLEEQGQIETQCHFCNTQYVFTPAEVEALIEDPDAPPPTLQ